MAIHHVASSADWERARMTGFYDRSTRDASIEEAGFLHGSDSLQQVRGVLERFYADVEEPLVLLTLDEVALRAAGLRVVVEPADPQDPDSERFPHVYGGPLPVGAVSRAEPIVRGNVPAEDDGTHLARAIDLATANASTDGGPFGALVVSPEGRAFVGANRVTASNDPTAHAEVTAIRAACRELGTFDLSGAVLYTSCEPCPMCLGAALWARVTRVVFAADRHDAADAGFDDATFYDYFEAPDRRTVMPVVHLASARSTAPFEAWAANEHRTEY